MKKILINKEIGGLFGITAESIREEFLNAGDEDIKIVVDCPGGECFEGISIYNFIRDFARNHTNNITTYIQGMAASAASWIVLAANSVNSKNRVIVEDNSIFMIHNCWNIAIGDYRELEKSADFCKRIDDLIKTMLSNRSKKDLKQIGKLMDAETWYFGNEIFDNGFCDEVITTEKSDTNLDLDFENKMNMAKMAFNSCQKKIRDEVEKNPEEYRNSFKRSLSAFNSINMQSKQMENKTEETKMTFDELKSKDNSLFNEVFNAGAKNAVENERKRVSNLLNKFEKAGNVSDALTFIENGKSISDEEVLDALLETQATSKGLENRLADEPPAFNPPATANEVEDEVTKAFKNAMGV